MADENVLSNDELELRWTALRQTLDNGGASACIAVIRSEAESSRRNQLYRLAVRKLGGGVGATSSELDAMISIGDAGIRDLLGVVAQVPMTPRDGKTTPMSSPTTCPPTSAIVGATAIPGIRRISRPVFGTRTRRSKCAGN